MSTITILAGPPGAGKTTIARELVAISEGALIYIEGDCFWKFIVNYDERTGFENFKATMSAMLGASIGYARNDFDVLLDFNMPPWYINKACEMARKRNIPLNYVVVRPSMDICANRAKTRERYAIPEYEDLQVRFYNAYDDAQKYMIDDNEAGAKAIAERIKRGLDAGLFRF